MLKKGTGTPDQAEITAFLGKGTEFKGVLSFEGTIRVDGKVEGEVVSKDTLIAGDGAYLHGEITVGTHGLIVERDGRKGVLLPQVPVENGWDRETFLEQASLKAGLPGDAWRRGAKLSVFEAIVFHE